MGRIVLVSSRTKYIQSRSRGIWWPSASIWSHRWLKPRQMVGMTRMRRIHTSQNVCFDYQSQDLNWRTVTKGPNLSIPSSGQLWVFQRATVSWWPLPFWTMDQILHRKAWPQQSKNRSRWFRLHMPDSVALAIEVGKCGHGSPTDAIIRNLWALINLPITYDYYCEPRWRMWAVRAYIDAPGKCWYSIDTRALRTTWTLSGVRNVKLTHHNDNHAIPPGPPVTKHPDTIREKELDGPRDDGSHNRIVDSRYIRIFKVIHFAESGDKPVVQVRASECSL
jgi:hypothetical protein